jgi:hypothetical protein
MEKAEMREEVLIHIMKDKEILSENGNHISLPDQYTILCCDGFHIPEGPA